MYFLDNYSNEGGTMSKKEGAEMKKLAVTEVTKENVKGSRFGCANCLWASIECKGQEKFAPKVYNGVATCERYTYYD